MYCPRCFKRDKSLQVGDMIPPDSDTMSKLSKRFAANFFYRWKKD